ncbi:ChaN family lipoprotein [Desulfobacter vibrioformis]|uniref:ChaN family lipoprotein n=1 Tax=Desulfobacter vibrioformis TaxID=34031 RepID=UPI000551A641|nr:ChaN family lipoprotein [Desulfobacter vibrioformis]
MQRLIYAVLWPVLGIVLCLFCGCATTSKIVMRDDPLIGSLVKGETGDPVRFADLTETLIHSDIIYLSEKHDNPMHHAIQHRVLQALIDQGRAPILGFEFFSYQDTPLLLNLVDAGQKKHSPKMEKAVEQRIREKLGWKNQSNTMWGYYWDLIRLAADNGLPAAGLDLSATQKRRITRKGLEGLSPIELQQLFSTNLSNPAYESYMKSVFVSVHCGMDHGRMTERLYDTWVARNDRMALSVVELFNALQTQDRDEAGRKTGPVVIIIGAGHTEYGLGVMDRVHHLKPNATQTNLAITEIDREPTDMSQYLAPLSLEGFDPVPPADYLWFTQRVSYEDPCEKFKAMLKKRQNTRPGL